MAEDIAPNKENPFSSFFSRVKDFFNPRPEPYNIITKEAKPLEIENQNPLQNLIKDLRDFSAKQYNELDSPLMPININALLFSEENFNRAIKYITPDREIKSGDTIELKGGDKISYEDLKKIAHDVENVSPNDVSFGGKLPKIYILPNLPPDSSKEAKLLENFGFSENNMVYVGKDDVVLIDSKFASQHNADEFKAAFAHEYGHRIDFSTRGFAVVEYNADKHSRGLLGSKFAAGCEEHLVDGKLPNDLSEIANKMSIIGTDEKCVDTIKHIYDDKNSANLTIMNKNLELSRERERRADLYATLAGYGNDTISTFKSMFEYSPPYVDGSHPSPQIRVEEIQQVMSNPEFYKETLNKELAKFKQYLSPAVDSGHEAKTPATPQAPTTEQNPNLGR
jgi:hypothetical protein